MQGNSCRNDFSTLFDTFSRNGFIEVYDMQGRISLLDISETNKNIKSTEKLVYSIVQLISCKENLMTGW